MTYSVNNGLLNKVFIVPQVLAENLTNLSSEKLKIILFLLSRAGEEFSSEDINKATGAEETEIQGAIDYLDSLGVKAGKTDFERQADYINKKITLERPIDISPAIIAEEVKNNPRVGFLFKECEKLFGMDFNYTKQRTVVILINDIGLPPECALLLIKHCIKIGRGNSPSEWKKIAAFWLEKGIDDIDKAQAEIERLNRYSKIEVELKEKLERTDRFSQNQKEKIRIWSEEWGFTLEMINIAIERNLDNKNEINFNYINGILKNWYKDKIITPADIEKHEIGYRDKGKYKGRHRFTDEQLYNKPSFKIERDDDGDDDDDDDD